jgi:hypothetical protein
LLNSASIQERTVDCSVAVRGNVERMVRPSKRRTLRATVAEFEPRDDEDFIAVIGGDDGDIAWEVCVAFLFFSFSRSALRNEASTLRAALSASIRALIRASSSASSLFFFRSASRASCCALLANADGAVGFGSGALCLPFALVDDGVGAGTGAEGVAIEGADGP